MAISAEIWTPGTNVAPTISALLFRDGDEALLKTALDSSGALPLAYSVTPNGARRHILIAAYIGARLSPLSSHSPRIFPEHHSASREIFASSVDISLGLREHNSELVILGCDGLRAAISRLINLDPSYVPPSLPRVVDYLHAFATDCLQPLEYSSPLVHPSNAPHHRSWWSSQASQLQNIVRMRKRLLSEFGTVPDGLRAIHTWLISIESRLKQMHAVPLNQDKRIRAILEASAYCVAIAERYLMRNHTGRSILLLHHSTDLLMLSLCAKHGAIDFTTHGGRYVTTLLPSGMVNKITLLTSMATIGHLLSPSSTRSADFEELNKWRNLLMEAHYMSSLDTSKALELFGKLRLHLEALGGTTWKTARDAYLGGIEIAPSDILDADRSLSTSIAPFQY